MQAYAKTDMKIDTGNCVVHVEIDVKEHRSYRWEKELQRMLSIYDVHKKNAPIQGVQKPMVIVRFNWSRYTVDKKEIKTTLETRHVTLVKYLKSIEAQLFTKPLTIVYICYSIINGEVKRVLAMGNKIKDLVEGPLLDIRHVLCDGSTEVDGELLLLA
jgi:hypothetical protein